ncbi:heterokaryon incompatibility protein-domain-containing protein [Cladorrhinum sp. PSN332]|nr:heterokaryon incompatibility protein-domain-containing protein [Cladorrhinum sp. PSN332]
MFHTTLGDPVVGNRDMAELLARDQEHLQEMGNPREDDAHRASKDENGPKAMTPLPAGYIFSHLPDPIYMPLVASEDQFRLLEILPAVDYKAPLRCLLHVCRLGENIGSYSALSYTWTASDEYSWTSPKFESIEFYGVRMAVRCNLYRALCRLRRAETSRLVWADAICINQDDLEERGQQVGRMGDIFRNAHEVLVWLGKGQSSARKAFEGICSVVTTWAGATKRARLPSEPQFSIQGVNGAISASESLSAESRAWINILTLYELKWFHRLWVVQEIALARRATVIWGKCEMSWEWIGLAAAIIRTNWNRIMPLRRGSLEDGRQVPRGVMNAYFMYRISDFQQALQPLRFSFCQLLALTRQFQCQDTRDNIFGLLGLPSTDGVNLWITPDYTQSLNDAYRKVALAMVERNPGSLAFLSHVHHHDAKMPAASGPPLPSWIPKWSFVGPQTLAPLDGSSTFAAGLGRSADFHLVEDDTLAVRGVILNGETISSLTEVLNFSDRDSSFTTSQRDFGEVRTVVARGESLFPLLKAGGFSVQDLEKIAMTLVAGKGWYGTPVTDRRHALADFADAVLTGRLVWALEEGAFGRTDGNEENGKRGRVGHAHEEGKEQSNIVSTDTLRELAKEGNGNLAMDAVATACTGRRLFTTSSGMKGVGPVEMKPGDRVCIIYGTSTPFIIRKAESKREEDFLFVGECYIDELMDGKVLKNGNSSEGWIHFGGHMAG